MKNKKIISIIFIIILILFLCAYFIIKNKSYKRNNIKEYIPEEEIAEEEIRKTIISLYFKNIENNTLIAEAQCIDVKELYDNPYTYLINRLIKGPENEKLESCIPEETKVNSCTLKGNTVYVDLSREFIENAPAGIEEESLIIYSIVNTLTELNEVNSVKFLINEEENLAFKDNAINFEQEFIKND